MKSTTNFDLDLMQPNLENKDVVYNDNLMMIDSLMNMGVAKFVDDVPADITGTDKYIVKDGEHKNKLCFKPHAGKKIKLIAPKLGMVIYSVSDSSFFAFDGEEWTKVIGGTGGDAASSSAGNVAVGSNSLLTGKEKFMGIEGDYEAPADHEFLHLYVNNDVRINLDKVKTRLITFVIKQHWQEVKNFSWPDNILWQGKKPHELSKTANTTDIVRIYRLVETNHFLGEIVGQGYQF